MDTLLLRRSEVMHLLDPVAVIPLLRAAFQAYSLDRTTPAQRVRSPLPGPGTAMILVPGLAPQIPAYTVKVHAKFPEQRPTIRGVLHLHDIQTGQLLAVMDSTYLTAVRTGIAGALAADVLARGDAATVAIVGAGAQGRQLLRSFAHMRQLEHVWVFDTSADAAQTYARELAEALQLPIAIAPTVAEAVAQADVVFTATWSRQPFLFPGMLRPGAHITTLGPDEPGKCEVDAALIQRGLFVCDDRDLAVAMGAIGGAGLSAAAIDAELGEVLAAAHPGRTSPEQITIYGGVGLAFQDLVVAWQVYQRAQQQGIGARIDFLE
jgi:ornithine cyclodeaminase/alanine dehydrogenase-like protein (mu-crystallin family)